MGKKVVKAPYGFTAYGFTDHETYGKVYTRETQRRRSGRTHAVWTGRGTDVRRASSRSPVTSERSDERRACSSDVALELGAAGMGDGGRHAMADARADAAGRLIIKYIQSVRSIIMPFWVYPRNRAPPQRKL